MNYKNLKLKQYGLSIVSNISQREHLQTAKSHFENCTGYKTKYLLAKKTNHRYNIRRGQKLGFQLIVYGKRIRQFIQKTAELKLKNCAIDKYGNICMGVVEYHQLSKTQYSPDVSNFGYSYCLFINYEGYYTKGKKLGKPVQKQKVIQYIKNKYANITIV